jgi:hypothetical protein
LNGTSLDFWLFLKKKNRPPGPDELAATKASLN